MEACCSNHWDLGCNDVEESLHPWEKECEEVVIMLGCGIQVKGVGWGYEIVPNIRKPDINFLGLYKLAQAFYLLLQAFTSLCKFEKDKKSPKSLCQVS